MSSQYFEHFSLLFLQIVFHGLSIHLFLSIKLYQPSEILGFDLTVITITSSYLLNYSTDMNYLFRQTLTIFIIKQSVYMLLFRTVFYAKFSIQFLNEPIQLLPDGLFSLQIVNHYFEIILQQILVIDPPFELVQLPNLFQMILLSQPFKFFEHFELGGHLAHLVAHQTAVLLLLIDQYNIITYQVINFGQVHAKPTILHDPILHTVPEQSDLHFLFLLLQHFVLQQGQHHQLDVIVFVVDMSLHSLLGFLSALKSNRHSIRNSWRTE